MSPRVRRTTWAASTALAAALAALLPSSASAAPAPLTERPTVSSATTEVVSLPTGKDGESAPHLTITFREKGQTGLNAGFLSCNVYLPLVHSDYMARSMEWQAGTTCNTRVVMSGSTRVYYWGSYTIGHGSTYNTWPGEALAGSQGTMYGVSNGTYGVDHNVTVDVPAGMTTSAGGGCEMINDNRSVKCQLTTGPIHYQPLRAS